MKKILYVKHANSSFVRSDQQILEKQYRVVPYLIHPEKTGFHFIRGMIGLAWFLVMNARGSSAMVSWFGDYHTALMVLAGRIMRIKVVIFAGGQEAISYPELGKGVYLKKWRGKIVRYALRNASLIIPNHESLILHDNRYYKPEGKPDGISHYNPGITTPMVVVPNGIDTGKYYRDPSIEKNPHTVLTVGTMSTASDFINKGFDLFTELARRNPGLRFTLIGIKKQFMPWIEENYQITSVANLKIIFSFCPDEILFYEYNRAKVFVQASITEGMPNTLNEAMLCGCIPVGSDVNGIPDAIGDTGIIVRRRDAGELDGAVHLAMQLESGTRASERVIANYSFLLREERLLHVFNQYI
jgi:glycosyltransferase involved in cell wall biosynthesis